MGWNGGQLRWFEKILGWIFLEENSEKGCSRKCTENRVASWTFLFWGNLGVLRCFTKRKCLGEFEIGVFLGFVRVST
jgi:hypothetical protein